MLNDRRFNTFWGTLRAFYHVRTHYMFNMCLNDFRVRCQFNSIVGSGTCYAMSSASIYVAVLRKDYILIVDGFNDENRYERTTLKRRCHLDDIFSHRRWAKWQFWAQPEKKISSIWNTVSVLSTLWYGADIRSSRVEKVSQRLMMLIIE